MTVAMIGLAVALPFVLGLLLLIRLDVHRRAHPSLVVGTAFGTGVALVGFVPAIVPLIGLPLTRTTGIASVLLAWAGLMAIVQSRRTAGAASNGVVPVSLLGWGWRTAWWVGVIVLGLKVAMAATRAMHKPVIGWDAMLVHSFKAKEMFYDQTISAGILDWAGSPNYPIGMSLAELWVAWFQGAWDDTGFKILFPCVLAALFLVIYGGLREIFGPIGALGGTWLAAGLPFLVQHATDAYFDLTLAYTTLAASVFLWRYARTRARSDLLVASWLAAFGVWTKNEGAVAFAVDLTALGALLVLDARAGKRPVWLDLVRFGAWPALVWGAWEAAKALWGIAPNLEVEPSGFLGHVDRLPTVVAFTAQELWQSANWNVLWALFAGGWVVWWRRSVDPVSLFFGWPVVLTLGVFVVVAEGTKMYDILLQGVVWHRVVLHVAPLAAFWVAVMLGEAIKKPVEETSTG
jgi:hypothetical protein